MIAPCQQQKKLVRQRLLAFKSSHLPSQLNSAGGHDVCAKCTRFSVMKGGMWLCWVTVVFRLHYISWRVMHVSPFLWMHQSSFILKVSAISQQQQNGKEKRVTAENRHKETEADCKEQTSIQNTKNQRYLCCMKM